MIELPEEDKMLLFDLIEEKNLSETLITELVIQAIQVRYQDKAIGFKDEISDLIKKYANDNKGNL